jgi:hypothetical protein
MRAIGASLKHGAPRATSVLYRPRLRLCAASWLTRPLQGGAPARSGAGWPRCRLRHAHGRREGESGIVGDPTDDRRRTRS